MSTWISDEYYLGREGADSIARGDYYSNALPIGEILGPPETDADGRSALHRAALYGNANEITALLEEEALATFPDKQGEFPLHLAASGGHEEAVKALLPAKYLDLNARVGRSDRTPLMSAALGSHTGVVELLLKAEAKPDLVDVHGWTALHFAVAANSKESVEALLAEGADPDICEREREETALHHAIIRKHYPSAAVLYQRASEETIESVKGLQYFVEFEEWCNTKINPEQKV